MSVDPDADPLEMELLNTVYADRHKIMLLEQTLIFKDSEISNLKSELCSTRSRDQVDQSWDQRCTQELVMAWEDKAEVEEELKNLTKVDEEKSNKIEQLKNYNQSLLKDMNGLRAELEELRKLKSDTLPEKQNGDTDAALPFKGGLERKRRCPDADM